MRSWPTLRSEKQGWAVRGGAAGHAGECVASRRLPDLKSGAQPNPARLSRRLRPDSVEQDERSREGDAAVSRRVGEMKITTLFYPSHALPGALIAVTLRGAGLTDTVFLQRIHVQFDTQARPLRYGSAATLNNDGQQSLLAK